MRISRSRLCLPALSVLLVGTGAFLAHGGQDRVSTPLVKAPERDFFARGMASINLSRYFEDDCGMAGSLLIGPPVILENDLHEFSAGTRVIPLALSYLFTHGDRYLGNEHRLILRPADSSKLYRGLNVYHAPEIIAELDISLREGITWGEVDAETDIIVHSSVLLVE